MLAPLKNTKSKWNRFVGAIVRHIRLNRVSIKPNRIVKHRNWFGQRIVAAANWFFRLCSAPVTFWKNVRQWQAWEVQCFRRLNRPYTARPIGEDGVEADRLPGESLNKYADRGELRRSMIIAAGRELRRCHGIWSDVYGGRWSHGDAGLPNFIYDPATRRARMIDFELTHDVKLDEATRQADDLEVFLLNLAAISTRQRWLPSALAFLRAYGKGKALDALIQRLSVPGGFARLWWKIRTHFTETAENSRRLAALRHVIRKGALGDLSDKDNPEVLASLNTETVKARAS